MEIDVPSTSQASSDTPKEDESASNTFEDDPEGDQALAEAVDAHEFLARDGKGMLEFEKQMFLDVLHSDVLVVCARYYSKHLFSKKIRTFVFFLQRNYI